MLSRLTNLYHSLYHQNLPSYYKTVESTIAEIKLLRCNINLTDYDSISTTTEQILSIKDQYSNMLNHDYLKQSEDNISQLAAECFTLTIDAMEVLLKRLYDDQSKLDENNQNDQSYQSLTSSTIQQPTYFHHNTRMNNNRIPSRSFHRNTRMHNSRIRSRSFRHRGHFKRLRGSYPSNNHQNHSRSDRGTFRSRPYRGH